MARKRKIFTYRSEGSVWHAQLDGHAYVGEGMQKLDAIADVLERFKGVSVEDLKEVPVTHPLPRLDETTCKGAQHRIRVTGSGKRFTATLSPHDDMRLAWRTAGKAIKAVASLMRGNPHLLRRGNRLSIIVGDPVFRESRLVISYGNREYIATLDDIQSAYADHTPIEAVCGILRMNPNIIAPGCRLNIFFPDRFKEPDYDELDV